MSGAALKQLQLRWVTAHRTGGREYETGRPIGSWTMPEPLVHRSASGRVYPNPVIIRPNRADRHFVERQGDSIMDIFFN
jgi:hypothetical protein